MGFIVQQLRYIIFFVFIVLRFPKPMSCQMQKRITSKTAADFSLRASGHCLLVAVFCQAGPGPGRALHIALKTDGASCAKIRLEMQKFVAMFMPLSVNISWDCFFPLEGMLMKCINANPAHLVTLCSKTSHL